MHDEPNQIITDWTYLVSYIL